MKTIGLVGGMSWESTVTYYQLLNRLARERLGGLHSAELVLWSFDFAEIEALQAAGDWDQATARMVEAARRVERAGADCLVICTNTMHRMAEAVQAAVAIPLIHIADATAAAVTAAGVTAPLLLATRYTMEQEFYKGRLKTRHGIGVRVPDAAGRTVVHDIIYNELCQGVVSAASKARYLEVVRQAEAEGADAVIFGCTEVGLLVAAEDFAIPSFDTTELHARAALDFALGE
ncbi:MAG: aspartate/glutamate racemase family protein [Kiloniellaceae bacterium]